MMTHLKLITAAGLFSFVGCVASSGLERFAHTYDSHPLVTVTQGPEPHQIEFHSRSIVARFDMSDPHWAAVIMQASILANPNFRDSVRTNYGFLRFRSYGPIARLAENHKVVLYTTQNTVHIDSTSYEQSRGENGKITEDIVADVPVEIMKQVAFADTTYAAIGAIPLQLTYSMMAPIRAILDSSRALK